jgi:TonB family protein
MKIGAKRCLSAALVVAVLLVSGGLAEQKQQEEQVLQLLKKARDVADIRAADSPPFSLRARIQAAPLRRGRKALDGTLLLYWVSPTRWRQEITFPGYSQVRIASQGKLWTTRNVPFEPVRAYQLEQLMDVQSQWTLREGESAREERKERKQKGVRLRCIEVKGELEPRRELCADAESLVPLTTRIAASHLISCEYGDYAPWGSREFPRLMRVYEDKDLVIEAQIEKLAPTLEPAASLLAPPASATAWDWCNNAEPATVLSKAAPHYPQAARRSGQEAEVSVYAVIATDGSLHDLAVVRSGGPDFDASALAAISRWRYRPGMCGINPIPTETVIEVRYRVGF